MKNFDLDKDKNKEFGLDEYLHKVNQLGSDYDLESVPDYAYFIPLLEEEMVTSLIAEFIEKTSDEEIDQDAFILYVADFAMKQYNEEFSDPTNPRKRKNRLKMKNPHASEIEILNLENSESVSAEEYPCLKNKSLLAKLEALGQKSFWTESAAYDDKLPVTVFSVLLEGMRLESSPFPVVLDEYSLLDGIDIHPELENMIPDECLQAANYERKQNKKPSVSSSRSTSFDL